MQVDLDGWKSKLYRRSESEASVENGMRGYVNFTAYLAAKQGIPAGDLVTLGAFLDKLKSGEVDVYKLLDKYAGWLTTERQPRLRGSTVIVWTSLTVSFLRYHDVTVDSRTFTDKVSMPKNREIEDEPVKDEELQKIVLAASPYMRAFYLLITSSGMRGGEACLLRIQDIDFETFAPIGVCNLRGVNTKTDKRRKAFVSDEAVKSLKVITEGRPKDELVFFKPGSPHRPDAKPTGYERDIITGYHNDLLKKIGLDKRIEGHTWRNLHLHNLGRKFFFSHMISHLGETATHALMGHGTYLSTYDRRPMDERVAEYKIAMQHVYVMQKTTQANKVQTIVSTLKLLYPGEDLDKMLEDVAKAKGHQWRLLDEESQYEVVKEAMARSQGKVGVTRHGKVQYETQAIPKDDLDAAMALIADGWEQVAPINGSVVYRREKAE